MTENMNVVEGSHEFLQELLCSRDFSEVWGAARNKNSEERSPGLTPIDSPSPSSPLDDRYDPDTTTGRLPVQDDQDEEDADEAARKKGPLKRTKR
jgi:hypothetical protein